MDTKSRVLFASFLLIVAAATVWKYDTFVTRHDFVVYDQVECDPEKESCFAYECDEGDSECDDAPFKRIEKNIRAITPCLNYEENACEPLACGESEVDCSEILCSDETLREGEICIVGDEEAAVDENIADPVDDATMGSEEKL